jgi:hypothetical protein
MVMSEQEYKGKLATVLSLIQSVVMPDDEARRRKNADQARAASLKRAADIKLAKGER